MRILTLVAACLASPLAAQDGSLTFGMQKAIEMPGHRSLMAVIAAPESSLSAFESDGCSGGMSWSWRVVADLFPDFEAAQGSAPPWESCCVAHDAAYHDAGGTTEAEASFAARLAADETLRSCVAAPDPTAVKELAERYEGSEARIGYAFELVAQSMFNAVRFGGGPCSGLPWRWGFGYPACVPGL